MDMTANRGKALLAALSQIERSFGKNAIMRMGQRKNEAVPVISSGSLALDVALGIGGYPRGRIVEIYGPESSGKSTLALHAVAEAQKAGGTALYIDAEHALDPKYARALGVDVDAMLLSQPDDGEQALEIADKMVSSGVVDIVVVDSVAALVPRAELEGEMGDSHVGLHARLMSQALRKLTGTVARTGALVIFINQIRCVAEDSLILTTEGLKEIRNVHRGDLVRGERGWTKVVEIHHGEVEEGIRLEVKDRPVLRLSASHRQTVLREDGALALEDVRADCLLAGRWLAYPSAPVALAGGEGAVSEAEALFLGMFFVSGSCIVLGTRGGKPGTSMVRFTKVSEGGTRGWVATRFATSMVRFTKVSEERRALVVSAVEAIGIGTVKVGPSWVSVGGPAAVARLRNVYGAVGAGLAKRIPAGVLAGSSEVIRSFLRGASFGTHGFSKQGFIWTFESAEQARTVWNLLAGFGVIADLRLTRPGKTKGRLYVTGQDAVAFAARVGFAEPSKAVQVFSAAGNARGKRDILPGVVGSVLLQRAKNAGVGVFDLPYYGTLKICLFKGLNISRPGLLAMVDEAARRGMPFTAEERRLLSDFRFARIETSAVDSFRCIDLEVEDGRFVAEGAVTHNSKIGVMFGNNETTTGGNALKFYASVRLDIRRIETIKEKDEAVGNKIRVKVVKNKMAPPFCEALFEIVYGKGVSRASEILEMGMAAGIVEKSGSWYSHDSQRLGQGVAQAKAFLEANPAIAETIVARIRDCSALVTEG
jgi:RecA/RadA recombinase